MPYFFIENETAAGASAEIAGSEAQHAILSLRVKKGEVVEVQTPEKKRWKCEVVEMGKKTVKIKVLGSVIPPVELGGELAIFQAVIAEKALDVVLQKSTELGAQNIFLFNSHHTPVRLSKEKFETRKERWERILKESCKQCGRAVLPHIHFLTDWQNVWTESQKYETLFLADPNGSVEVSGKPLAALIVGPEGGFAEDELAQIKSRQNCRLLKLSNFVLRSETAAVAGLSRLLSLY